MQTEFYKETESKIDPTKVITSKKYRKRNEKTGRWEKEDKMDTIMRQTIINNIKYNLEQELKQQMKLSYQRSLERNLKLFSYRK